MACETAFAVPTSPINMKGSTTGKVDAVTIRKMPTAASRSFASQRRTRRYRRKRDDSPADGLHLRLRDQTRRDPRQRPVDEPAPGFGVRRRAHRAHERERAAAIGHRAHQVHDGIDQAPGEVAAQGSGQHVADLVLPRLPDGHRADESERHEQAEEQLRDAVDRAQQGLARRFGLSLLFAHGLAPAIIAKLIMVTLEAPDGPSPQRCARIACATRAGDRRPRRRAAPRTPNTR